jgi:hypothetical protein
MFRRLQGQNHSHFRSWAQSHICRSLFSSIHAATLACPARSGSDSSFRGGSARTSRSRRLEQDGPLASKCSLAARFSGVKFAQPSCCKYVLISSLMSAVMTLSSASLLCSRDIAISCLTSGAAKVGLEARRVVPLLPSGGSGMR